MGDEVLIAGAGPTGLAAALFLTKRGVRCRVVDKTNQPSRYSKALAVNPRTLSLLQGTGVDEAIKSEGRAIGAMTLMRERKPLVELPVHDLDPRDPFTVIPQARTAALLREALKLLGVEPEWACELAYLEQEERTVHVRLTHGDGRSEDLTTPLLFTAEGAHSTVRKALGIDFPGSALPEPWELADVVYDGSVEQPEAFVDFEPHGFVFAMSFDAARTTWRYMSTVGDPVLRPPGAPPVKEVTWRSSFKISHRIAARLAVGRVALAGDSAHLHSPLGARGMNLGIEDAYVFAACACDALASGTSERIADYGRLRHAADKGVVKRVEMMTRMVRGKGAFRFVRAAAPPLVAHMPPALNALRHVAAGLDHQVRLS